MSGISLVWYKNTLLVGQGDKEYSLDKVLGGCFCRLTTGLTERQRGGVFSHPAASMQWYPTVFLAGSEGTKLGLVPNPAIKAFAHSNTAKHTAQHRLTYIVVLYLSSTILPVP